MLSSLLFNKKKKDPNASMQRTSKPLHPFNPPPLGLKTLIPDPLVGDREIKVEEACWGVYGWRRRPRPYPPALPYLARTGNLKCRTPWVLNRIHKEDGSLVIEKAEATRHEYFKVSREDGRLTLQHMYLDYDSPVDSDPTPPDEEPPRLLMDLEPQLPPIRCRIRGNNRENFRSQTPRIVGSSSMEALPLTELSSSLPEPIFPDVRKGCFEYKPTLFREIPRMRTVRS